MKKIKELYKKYKEIVNYLIFGVLTTLVNIITYAIFAKLFHVDEVVSNIVAQIISILFAYVTNKIYVFESKSTKLEDILRELVSFFGCRIFTAVLDTVLFSFMIKILGINDLIAKCITQVIVIVLNYIFSKVLIFRKKDKDKLEENIKKQIKNEGDKNEES